MLLLMRVLRAMRYKTTGFSLIEVLLTFCLLILILMGTMQLLAQAARLKEKTDLLAQMTAYLVNRLEELKSLPPDSPERQGDHYEEFEDSSAKYKLGCYWRQVQEASQAWRLEIEVSSLQPQGHKVQATLWTTSLLGF